MEERNYFKEICEMSIEDRKKLILSIAFLDDYNEWASTYGARLKLTNAEMIENYLRNLIDYMIDEDFLIDLVQDIIHSYSCARIIAIIQSN